MPKHTSFRPLGGYHRRRLHAAANREEALAAGLLAVADLEELRAWVREQGLIPPKPACEEEVKDILACPATAWQKEFARQHGH